MILALLLAAQPQVFAVLEFRDKVPAEQRIDAAYLSDQVRSAVKELVPQARVITRENMLVLLQASGKKLEECDGECEVDTGRRIGADLVASGELLRFGTQYKLNMKLHDTRSGELLAGAVASGATADELDRNLRPAVEKLVASLRPEAAQDRLSDARQAARPLPEPERPGRRYKDALFGLSVSAGYASTTVSGSLPTSDASAGGFSLGVGGHFYLHLAGPIYVGALADYSLLPGVGNSSPTGILAGGALRLDFGETALFAGGGYSDLSDNGGSGYGLIGGFEYGVLLLQIALRHGSASVVSGAVTVEQTTRVIAAQAGVSVNF